MSVVVTFSNGETVVFKNREEWNRSSYATRLYTSASNAKEYDPSEEYFDRYKVILKFSDDEVIVTSERTRVKEKERALLRSDGFLDDGMLYHGQAFGFSTESFAVAMSYALSAWEEL